MSIKNLNLFPKVFASQSKYLLILLSAGIILLMTMLSGCDSESKEQTLHPYPDVQNVSQDIKNALSPQNKDKRVLLEFGANWCPYCRRLDATLKQDKIASYVNSHFITIKVNVGKYNQNEDIAKRYDLKVRKGIPVMLVLDHNGAVQKRINPNILTRMHKKGRDTFFEWFKTI
jgi:thiol:disulfide interchange protein